MEKMLVCPRIIILIAQASKKSFLCPPPRGIRSSENSIKVTLIPPACPAALAGSPALSGACHQALIVPPLFLRNNSRANLAERLHAHTFPLHAHLTTKLPNYSTSFHPLFVSFSIRGTNNDHSQDLCSEPEHSHHESIFPSCSSPVVSFVSVVFNYFLYWLKPPPPNRTPAKSSTDAYPASVAH